MSVETIYNGFGSKKGLLEAARDFSIVGDSAPVPLVERPEFRPLGEGSLDERIARAAAMAADIHARSAGVWQAIVEAASTDEEIDGWRLEQEQGRHERLRQSASSSWSARRPDEPLVDDRCGSSTAPRRTCKLVHDCRLHPRGVRGLPRRRHQAARRRQLSRASAMAALRMAAIAFDRDQLVDEAIAATGFDDFGEPTWQEGLDRLLDSLATEAQLNELGVTVVESEVGAYLRTRLGLVAHRAAHPELGDRCRSCGRW